MVACEDPHAREGLSLPGKVQELQIAKTRAAETQNMEPSAPPKGRMRHPLTKIERTGRGIWAMLHMLADMFSDPIVFSKILERTINEVLPCPICQADAREYLSKNPITEETYPPLWICTFHNHVNLKLRNRVFPCEPYMQIKSLKSDFPSNNGYTSRDCFSERRVDDSDFVDDGYYID